MKGILGKKVGMTQVFTEEGKLIPVTVISVEPNVVTQIKTKDNDGYEAIQLGFETIKEKSSNKPKIGHTKKANTEPKRFLREIRGVNVNDYKIGDTLTANIFEVGDVIDITGISKGKGFQGSIKRHNFARGPMSHGSQYHRGVGSLGTLRPMRVFKGTELPGHMGAELTTIQNSFIVDVIEDENVILVKGNVPGPKKGLVIVKSAIKNKDKKIEMANLINYTKEEKVEEVAEENSAESQE
jgi:50S ribosomal protein L3